MIRTIIMLLVIQTEKFSCCASQIHKKITTTGILGPAHARQEMAAGDLGADDLSSMGKGWVNSEYFMHVIVFLDRDPVAGPHHMKNDYWCSVICYMMIETLSFVV